MICMYRKSIELIDSASPFALATVIRASGSTPQKAGAKAIFLRDGQILGTLGGGCLEAESRRRALAALDAGRNIIFDIALDSDYGWDDGLICGGNVRVAVDVNFAGNRDVIQQMLHDVATGRARGVLEVRWDAARVSQYHWIPDSDLRIEWQHACLNSGRSKWFDEDDGERYLEPIVPSPRLLIAGAGHVGAATAKLAASVGFEVTVVDDRAAFADHRHFPDGVTVICGDIAASVRDFPKEPDTYIIIVTRGHQHDKDALAACVGAPVAYIGLIGSKRKILMLRKRFIDARIATQEMLERVHSPIGLNIGAVTVEEIAVSIVSQLVAVRRHPKTSINRVGEAMSL